MKMLTMLVVLALCVPQFAAAVSVSSGGGKKSVARMLDSSGGPLSFNDDKPWKVFEVNATASAVQVVDESGVAPKQGMVKRVCVETGSTLTSVMLAVVLWDTATAAGVTLGGAGYRIMPPLMRATLTVTCTEVNALFTSGVAVLHSSAIGSTYVYWRELGGYR